MQHKACVHTRDAIQSDHGQIKKVENETEILIILRNMQAFKLSFFSPKRKTSTPQIFSWYGVPVLLL